MAIIKDTDDYYHIESSNMCLTYKIGEDFGQFLRNLNLLL